jgi:uncharacterized protein
MNVHALLGLVLLVIPMLSAAQARDKPTKPDFETYQLVILKRGPKAAQLSQSELEKLQKEHLAHLTRMGEEGKMVIAGPFSAQADESFRGLCLYRVSSLDEAKRLAEADPMVKAGRLEVAVMNWHVEKGYMTFPKAPTPSPSHAPTK